MPSPRFLLGLVSWLPALGLAGEPVAAVPAEPEQHAAHAAHAAPVADTPAPAVRWTADAPLSRGMQRVRAATEALAHGGHDHLDAAQVQAIAAELRLAVDDMFANCRLAPEPDAALHPLLARVLAASRALSAGEVDAHALETLHGVLADYPRLFEDPAWRASQSD